MNLIVHELVACPPEAAQSLLIDGHPFHHERRDSHEGLLVEIFRPPDNPGRGGDRNREARLIAAGLTALVADATIRSVETVALYGMVKLVSDLVLVIAVVWLAVALFRVVRPAKR